MDQGSPKSPSVRALRKLVVHGHSDDFLRALRHRDNGHHCSPQFVWAYELAACPYQHSNAGEDRQGRAKCYTRRDAGKPVRVECDRGSTDGLTEEFSHLEIVGATITMLLDGVNGELKNAAEACPLNKLTKGKAGKEEVLHEALTPLFLIQSGGGPTLTNSQGVPFSGSYIDANGDLTVDLRSDMAAEARAKITYEYLMKFTDDPLVHDSLRFLMTREIAHFQMFGAALDTIQPNFPMGVLQGDPRHTHTYFNLSNGADERGRWNEGQGPWDEGESWEYVKEPVKHVIATDGEINHEPKGVKTTQEQVAAKNKEMSKKRSEEVKSKTASAPAQWSSYPQDKLESPMQPDTSRV